jgi:CRISPR/Cas system CSM-associated protein Csm3 (group 7 of RAMP superfamily)
MPDMHRLDSALDVAFETSHHLGTGRTEGVVDRTVRRDAGGRPYVPGSAIKGALRQSAERLAHHLDQHLMNMGGKPSDCFGRRQRAGNALDEACRAPDPRQMCIGGDPCIVCRVFGNVMTGRRLLVADASSRSDDPEAKTHQALADDEDDQTTARSPISGDFEAVTHLSVDRRRRGAAHGKLFTSEYARPETTFQTRLSGQFHGTPVDDETRAGVGNPPRELVLLVGAVRLTRQIGAEASTGHGRCRLRFGQERVSLGDVDYDVDALFDAFDDKFLFMNLED